MEQNYFRDYYEDLQVNPHADFETVERVFRLLAKRYHPDNKQTGDAEKFSLIFDAYQHLSVPEKRAAYDANYERASTPRWRILEQAIQSDGFEADDRMRQCILALLYVARRQDGSNPGMGIMELEKSLGCPQQVMEFHIWYLKEKGWILRTETGGYAITASGVDKVAEHDLLSKDRLLPETSQSEYVNENETPMFIN